MQIHNLTETNSVLNHFLANWNVTYITTACVSEEI
jgi:hypothetical protein